VVVVGNFTNEPISAATTFPELGDWLNYLNPTDKITVHSQTMPINVPAKQLPDLLQISPIETHLLHAITLKRGMSNHRHSLFFVEKAERINIIRLPGV